MIKDIVRIDGLHSILAWISQVNRKCLWGSERKKKENKKKTDKEVKFYGSLPISCRPVFCKILWESAPLSIWGNQSKCKLRWQLRPQVRRGSVRVSNPIPLIIEVEELQSINAEAVENGWHIWHILLLLGHWAWPQGLACGWRKASTFSIKLLKNYRV